MDRMLACGADGVSVGSPFIASVEAPITERISGTPCSVITTPYVQAIGTHSPRLERLLNRNRTLKKWVKMLRFRLGMKATEAAAQKATYKTVRVAGPSIARTCGGAGERYHWQVCERERMILRPATADELPTIWAILQYAIEQRRLDGSRQWQDGYPNPDTVRSDLEQGVAHVVEERGTLLLYAAVIPEPEPAYEAIEGRWLTEGPYMVLHRVAASPEAKGRGIATTFFRMVEDLCRERGVNSIKVDTNFDNGPMLRIMDKLGYTYCGEVHFRGSPRRAYEKVVGRGRTTE